MRYQNNPGNIRTNPDFKGFVQADNGFSTFSSLYYGYRAISVLLNTYFNTYNLKTIKGIISRYAPGSENNTTAYINFVANQTGFGPDQILTESDLVTLIPAIVKMENGINITTDQVKKILASGPIQTGVIILFGFLSLGFFYFLKKKN
jgi:hypothetical protein